MGREDARDLGEWWRYMKVKARVREEEELKTRETRGKDGDTRREAGRGRNI